MRTAYVEGNADDPFNACVTFYNSDKNRTMDEMDDLITTTGRTIDDKDARTLSGLRAGPGFFSMPWDGVNAGWERAWI